jgi:HAD superfamily hydrolase (TIGR01509 family)
VIDSILFDFDGVLADTEPVHYRAWQQILAPFGIHLDWAYYVGSCIGRSDKDMVATLCDLASGRVIFDAVWARYDAKKALFRELSGADPPFDPEVVAFVRSLAPHYKLAVVTSSGRTEVEPLLELAGLSASFAAGVFGREAGALKPDPAPYRLAAQRLAAEHPLVVEDSDAGVESGKAAGFEVIRVPNPAAVPKLLKARLRLPIIDIM